MRFPLRELREPRETTDAATIETMVAEAAMTVVLADLEKLKKKGVTTNAAS